MFFLIYNPDRHCTIKRIDMDMKLDHEVRLTRRQSWDMQNFEADLFYDGFEDIWGKLGG